MKRTKLKLPINEKFLVIKRLLRKILSCDRKNILELIENKRH